jgi:hypothetical protein
MDGPVEAEVDVTMVVLSDLGFYATCTSGTDSTRRPRFRGCRAARRQRPAELSDSSSPSAPVSGQGRVVVRAALTKARNGPCTPE